MVRSETQRERGALCTLFGGTLVSSRRTISFFFSIVFLYGENGFAWFMASCSSAADGKRMHHFAVGMARVSPRERRG